MSEPMTDASGQPVPDPQNPPDVMPDTSAQLAGDAADANAEDGAEPQAQPFEEDAGGGDPDSTEGADIPAENLDLEPADNADHADQSEDASNEAG